MFSGKKGKKSKGTVISLQSFLSNGDVPAGTTQVAKNIRNVDGEDSDDGGKVLTVVCQLPTAPRANRIFDDNSIPHKAPFIAYVTNLPFDVKEDDIYEYFNANNVKSVRLPREDGETGRVRGFGYVEFESRDDLIHSLGIPDPTIKGRRIRIDLSNENEQNSRQRGMRRGYDTVSSNVEGRESTNWRRDNNQKRESYNFGNERNSNRDQKSTSDDFNSPGSWRQKNPSNSATVSSPDQIHQKDRYASQEEKNSTSERPKLMLKPRTLPLPELDVQLQVPLKSKVNDNSKFTGTSAEKVFGSAKPVDTTARDLEIEERLADVRRQDNLKKDVIKTTNDFNELNIAINEQVTNLDQNWRQQCTTDDKHDKKYLRTGMSSLFSSSNVEGRESTNWRRDNNQKRESYNFGNERNSNRDQKSTSDDFNSPGSWRQKNPSNSATVSSPDQIHQKDRYASQEEKNSTSERPKLMLKPRTLPLPELDVQLQVPLKSKVNDNSKFTGTSAEKVFGSAKPVDTTARDLEIEERLADVRRQDNLKKDVIKTTNDFNELNIAINEQVTNLDQNWRQQCTTDDKHDKKYLRTDKHRENVRDNRKKYQDRSEGSDTQKNRDVKPKDAIKSKREIKPDRQTYKNTHNQSDHAIQSSNMYSGLDEVSD
ncbi:eukaryotic translation initiation factor 4B [Lucilia sericata]|uniref:eukaryotic translation initiation factor 4B n=1 Tax=Lucilia sericata TaxID=13632 RepID=UPI0018A84D48|nr:eukaryotic translation initiation factor 4B [Lucilia sericata]